MEGKGRERSVGDLQLVYTVVICLAIAESLRQLLAGYGVTGKGPGLPAIVAALSLLVTVVPFYHGTSRYLDATYLAGERSAKSGALMVDACMVLVQGLFFFALAMLVQNTTVFFTMLAFVFVLQVAWVGLTQITAAGEEDRTPEFRSWAVANVVAAALILISLWSNVLRWSFWPSAVIQAVAMGLVALGRTVHEYASVWGFYYPPDRPGYIMPVPRPAPAPRGAQARRIQPARKPAAG